MAYNRSDEWNKLQKYIDNIVSSSNGIDRIYVTLHGSIYAESIKSQVQELLDFKFHKNLHFINMVENLFKDQLFEDDYLGFKDVYKKSMTIEIDRTEGNSLIDIWTFYFIQIDSKDFGLKDFSIVFYGSCRKEKSAIHKVTSLKCQEQLRGILKNLFIEF